MANEKDDSKDSINNSVKGRKAKFRPAKCNGIYENVRKIWRITSDSCEMSHQQAQNDKKILMQKTYK